MTFDPKGATCTLCPRPLAVKKHGWCWSHYLRARRNGGNPDGSGKRLRGDPIVHGTWVAYGTGCRCLDCRHAARVYSLRQYYLHSPMQAASREEYERRQVRVAAANARERARQTRLWLDTAASPLERENMELLLAQQAADAGRDRAQYAPSLDALQDGADGTRSYGIAVHFDRPDDQWPFFAERGRTRHMLVTA